ncbi:TPA: hypothetical protein ACH3X2_002519 [Trebouxia sp. C0005]
MDPAKASADTAQVTCIMPVPFCVCMFTLNACYSLTVDCAMATSELHALAQFVDICEVYISSTSNVSEVLVGSQLKRWLVSMWRCVLVWQDLDITLSCRQTCC